MQPPPSPPAFTLSLDSILGRPRIQLFCCWGGRKFSFGAGRLLWYLFDFEQHRERNIETGRKKERDRNRETKGDRDRERQSER